MAWATNLGFPRIGLRRELKRATEAFWRGDLDEASLLKVGADLRRRHWELQRAAGIDVMPSNDFSFYDHVLDTACLVGAVPERYGRQGQAPAGTVVPLQTMFAMARGTTSGAGGVSHSVPAMEMTKWFDTNYHYIVPEFRPEQRFVLASRKPVEEFREALALGFRTRPVLVGPVSFLLLGKVRGGGGAAGRGDRVLPSSGWSPDAQGAGDQGFARLALLDRLLPVYQQVLRELQQAGAEWVQLDEPFLALDLTDEERAAFVRAYRLLADAVSATPQAPGQLKLFVATYFEGLRENLPTALSLPVAALHLDLVRAPGQLEEALELGVPEGMALSLGVVDGRNVWRTDLDAALALLRRARQALGPDRLFVAPSCSLIHVPVDVEPETRLDPEVKSWLAFARQKLEEVALLARAVDRMTGNQAGTRLEGGSDAAVAPDADLEAALAANRRIIESRRRSPRLHNSEVHQRLAALTAADARRASPHAERRQAQQERLRLPMFPTTTIGSFPQTPELRQLRARWRRGDLTGEDYEAGVRREIERVIRLQEQLGLDVLVHGEPERNDMVEYFGEQMEGFAFTEQGWVQSYGSRYVKPPIIYGDVWRPAPITVRWITYAQSLTGKPVKGMLTGPVTILQWSFVRDDQPREVTCKQIGLAIRDEVRDLEAAGIGVIQIDEPAFREGLPLRRADWAHYLGWATFCFRLATSGVRDETQIHTHMCYSEFNDIIASIAALDADVISIEASRSGMELLEAFRTFRYPNEIGPGVYDIHSPRVPPVPEMVALLQRAAQVLDPTQLWVNPDCGLKTRTYDEAIPSLRNLVAAAKAMRQALSGARAEGA